MTTTRFTLFWPKPMHHQCQPASSARDRDDHLRRDHLPNAFHLNNLRGLTVVVRRSFISAPPKKAKKMYMRSKPVLWCVSNLEISKKKRRKSRDYSNIPLWARVLCVCVCVWHWCDSSKWDALLGKKVREHHHLLGIRLRSWVCDDATWFQSTDLHQKCVTFDFTWGLTMDSQCQRSSAWTICVLEICFRWTSYSFGNAK